MVKFAVYARIKVDMREEFLSALHAYLPNVAQEAQTLQYDVCEAESEEGTFLLFEAYNDQSGVEAHQTSEAFTAYIEAIKPMLAAPPVSMKLVADGKSHR